ncbi:MAG: hypothetical protein M3N19_00615 [Candidatus Eremiobacteraeota bacterium]|nr:hypothetical protein [Candidatus Eremiobacteraeota bacterium]
MQYRVAVFFIASLFVVQATPVSGATSPPAELYSGLHWRSVGPARGGRVIAATGVPGNATTFYFGSVGGGVWKTTDAGVVWTPIFDGQPVASIGAIAVAPSDPNVLYVGTGEADMREDIIHGNGMYKSVDAGAHWTHIGLEDTRQIGHIVVDPQNPNRVFVAALGHAYASNEERGVFRSEDGGATWTKVLYKNADTGAIDLAMDPGNSDVLYASLWQTRRPPWTTYPPSNGPGSGLYKTTDGGTTWTQLHGGLPTEGLGHIGIGIARSNSQRVYAIVDAQKGGLYRSDDGGGTWKLADGENRIWGRGWYFEKVAVDPKDSDTVYVSNTALYRSTNGGADFAAIKGAPGGDDYQGVWIDPTDGSRMILASDQGAVISVNRAQTWSSWYNQPTGEFYHVITDNQFPYWIYGAQQDSGAIGVQSRSNYRGISFRNYKPIAAGGESGYIVTDPDDARILYGAATDAFDQVTGQDRNISPLLAHPGVYRTAWTLPVVLSKRKPHHLYFGTQVLFASTDHGKQWKIISPDLSRPHPGIPATLDPVTAKDNSQGPRPGVIFAVAPSPKVDGMIWAGTDDGKIWLTRDDGHHWGDVTPPALGAWSKVGMIAASAHSALVAYAAVERHRLDDDRPYIYRTQDAGRTWQPIVSGIPSGSFVNAVREDPLQRGLLYAGTEHGVYVSFNDGAFWQPLKLNLPDASIRDLDARTDDLVIASHGRGFWVLDSIAPLREIAAGTIAGTHLFTPVVALRLRPGDDQGTPLPLETAQGENPPNGAMIDYYIAQTASPAILQIFDRAGHLVRRYSSAQTSKPIDPKSLDIAPIWAPAPPMPSAQAGMHRFLWDLHYGGSDGSGTGPLAPPGTYTVRLTANGVTRSQSLKLRKDPRVAATDAAFGQQFALAQQVQVLSAQASAAYHDVDKTRKSVKDKGTLRLLDAIAGGPAQNAPGDFNGQESNLYSLHHIGDILDQLQGQIEGADAAPTPDMVRALTSYRKALARTLSRWEALKKTLR